MNAAALLDEIEKSGRPMMLPNIYLSPNSTETISLDRYFADSEKISFVCTVADESVADVSQNGTSLVIKAKESGVTTIKVQPDNAPEQKIVVTVRNNANGNGWL